MHTVYRNMKNNVDRAKDPEPMTVTGEVSFAEGNCRTQSELLESQVQVQSPAPLQPRVAMP